MRWQIPIVVLLMAGLAVSCDQAPTAAEDSPSDVPDIVMNADGNNGAVRWMPDPACAVIDGYGELVFVSCTNQIATYSKNGNAVVVVKASGVPTPGGVVRWGPDDPGPGMVAIMAEYFDIFAPPYPCVVFDPNQEWLYTLNWSGMVTPSGQATFICHYAKKWEYQWP